MSDTDRYSSEVELSFSNARRYAGLLEPVPQRISMAITTLNNNHIENLNDGSENISKDSLKSIYQIERTASLRVPLYFAASKLYPERFKASEDDATKAIISVLGPGLFAAIVGLVYYYRRGAKLLNNSEEWAQLSKSLLISMEMGFHLGTAIKTIGPAEGVLIGGIRHVALSAFMIRDVVAYTKAKKNRHYPEIDTELPVWGCHHAQVAAYLIQRLGYTGVSTYELHQGLNPREPEPVLERFKSWRLLINILDNFRNKSFILDDSSSSGGTSNKGLGDIQTKLRSIMKDGSSFTWMNRGESDSE